MTEFFVGQQVVITEIASGEDLMGTVKLINSEKIAVQIEGDPHNIVHWVRPENVKSYTDIYTQTNPTPNVFVGPFANGIIKGLVTEWLNKPYDYGYPIKKNRDYPFDEEDSFSWTVREMLDIEENLR